jgi:hypothetical protein
VEKRASRNVAEESLSGPAGRTRRAPRLRERRERRGKGRRAHLPIEGFGGGVLGDAA